MTGATLTRPTTEIVLPYPHKGQRTVRREARRHNWLAAGRRWRKTTLLMAIVVEEAMKGKQIIWGAPTYDQVRIGWTEARKAAGGVATFLESRMTAEIGKGRIIYRSLDNPDNARGHSADGIVIDEAGDVPEAAYYEVLRPMLVDTGGWSWAIGTPKGRNWFWREMEAARDHADAKAWAAPTLGVRITESGLIREPHALENPSIQFEEIERLWRTLPERTFRQEFLAEFVEESGAVFRRVREAATLAPAGPIAGHQYVVGCDWGKSNDFSVFSVIDATTRQQVYQDRSNQIDYLTQIGRLQALCARYRPSAVVAERNSIGEPIIEHLRRLRLPVVPWVATNASKQMLVEALSLAFEQGQIRILNDPTLVSELQAYEVEKLPSGMIRYSAPDGQHDDTVIALGLAWLALCEPDDKPQAMRFGG
jgi:hypothetical protein